MGATIKYYENDYLNQVSFECIIRGLCLYTFNVFSCFMFAGYLSVGSFDSLELDLVSIGLLASAIITVLSIIEIAYLNYFCFSKISKTVCKSDLNTFLKLRLMWDCSRSGTFLLGFGALLHVTLILPMAVCHKDILDVTTLLENDYPDLVARLGVSPYFIAIFSKSFITYMIGMSQYLAIVFAQLSIVIWIIVFCLFDVVVSIDNLSHYLPGFFLLLAFVFFGVGEVELIYLKRVHNRKGFCNFFKATN